MTAGAAQPLAGPHVYPRSLVDDRTTLGVDSLNRERHVSRHLDVERTVGRQRRGAQHPGERTAMVFPDRVLVGVHAMTAHDRYTLDQPNQPPALPDLFLLRGEHGRADEPAAVGAADRLGRAINPVRRMLQGIVVRQSAGRCR